MSLFPNSSVDKNGRVSAPSQLVWRVWYVWEEQPITLSIIINISIYVSICLRAMIYINKDSKMKWQNNYS